MYLFKSLLKSLLQVPIGIVVVVDFYVTVYAQISATPPLDTTAFIPTEEHLVGIPSIIIDIPTAQ